MPSNIVVVGASLAGLRAVETLRAEGFDGRIAWVGDEPYLPYDRPRLSKEFLRGDAPEDALHLRRVGYEDLDIDLYLGQSARVLDARSHQIELDDGTRLPFDGALIATGARARAVPGVGAVAGVYVLRTLDDARAIRAALSARPRVGVIGGGLLGSEVAAACRALGLSVVLIESAPVLCGHVLGVTLGAQWTDVLRDEGIDVRCGVEVVALDGARRVESLRLSDGSALAVDLVVSCIGAEPATSWLLGSPLELADGVLCDATCATRVPGIYAAGDVARVYHPIYGRHLRIDHAGQAEDQGVTAGRALVRAGVVDPLVSVPTFGSDPFGEKLQVVGVHGSDAELHVIEGDLRSRRIAAAFVEKGAIVAGVTCNDPRRAVQFRHLVARGAGVAELAD